MQSAEYPASVLMDPFQQLLNFSNLLQASSKNEEIELGQEISESLEHLRLNRFKKEEKSHVEASQALHKISDFKEVQTYISEFFDTSDLKAIQMRFDSSLIRRDHMARKQYLLDKFREAALRYCKRRRKNCKWGHSKDPKISPYSFDTVDSNSNKSCKVNYSQQRILFEIHLEKSLNQLQTVDAVATKSGEGFVSVFEACAPMGIGSSYKMKDFSDQGEPFSRFVTKKANVTVIPTKTISAVYLSKVFKYAVKKTILEHKREMGGDPWDEFFYRAYSINRENMRLEFSRDEIKTIQEAPGGKETSISPGHSARMAKLSETLLKGETKRSPSPLMTAIVGNVPNERLEEGGKKRRLQKIDVSPISHPRFKFGKVPHSPDGRTSLTRLFYLPLLDKKSSITS